MPRFTPQRYNQFANDEPAAINRCGTATFTGGTVYRGKDAAAPTTKVLRGDIYVTAKVAKCAQIMLGC
jgi:hypothetical protein